MSLITNFNKLLNNTLIPLEGAAPLPTQIVPLPNQIVNWEYVYKGVSGTVGTVPSGKIYYMTHFVFQGRTTGAARARVQIFNSSAVLQKTLSHALLINADEFNHIHPYTQPIILTTGDYIYVTINAGIFDLSVLCSFNSINS